MARAISDWISPTTDLNRTSMPSLASSSAKNKELASDFPPIKSSDPMAMVSAVSGGAAQVGGTGWEKHRLGVVSPINYRCKVRLPRASGENCWDPYPKRP